MKLFNKQRIKLLVIGIICLYSFRIFPNDDFKSIINKAWDEYSFKEINKAKLLFLKASELAKTKQEKCEALTGIAFCFQFGKRSDVTSDDYLQAIKIYDEALAMLEKSDRLRPFFLAMKAECLMYLSLLYGNQVDSKNFKDKADEIWAILDLEYPTDVFRQDSLLTRTALASDDYRDEKSIKAHENLKKYISSLSKESSKEETLLASVMCSQIAEFSLINSDYKSTIEYLKLYSYYGPTSFPMKANAYFRIARISELITKDKKTAIEFYRRFYNECNSNEKAYFAKKKAEELSGEKLNQESKIE